MVHTLEIRATAEGLEYWFEASHKWRFLNKQGADWILDAVAGIGEFAQALAANGKGQIRGEFLTVLNGNAQSVVVEGLSKKDVTAIERAFYEKAIELVEISESKS